MSADQENLNGGLLSHRFHTRGCKVYTAWLHPRVAFWHKRESSVPFFVDVFSFVLIGWSQNNF